MRFGSSTLLDVLSSRQFRTAVLVTLGLDIRQIADLLETTEHAVCGYLRDSFHLAYCQNVKELAERMLYECENDLHDEDRLNQEIAQLQSAAMKMLQDLSHDSCRTGRLGSSLLKCQC